MYVMYVLYVFVCLCLVPTYTLHHKNWEGYLKYRNIFSLRTIKFFSEGDKKLSTTKDYVCQYFRVCISMLCMSICNSVHIYVLYVNMLDGAYVGVVCQYVGWCIYMFCMSICWMAHMYFMYVNMLDGAYVCYVCQYAGWCICMLCMLIYYSFHMYVLYVNM